MITPPPLPIQAARTSFYHYAATASILAIPAAILINLAGQFGISDPNIKSAINLIAALLACAILFLGVIAGVVALFGIPKYGRKGILIKALCGILIPIVLTGLAIPSIIYARGMALQLQAKNSTDQVLVKLAADLTKGCPQQIDEVTTMTGVEAMPDQTLVYKYTITSLTREEIDIATLEESIRPNFLTMYRSQPEMKPFRDEKVTLVYRYSDKDGQPIGDVSVGPKDL